MNPEISFGSFVRQRRREMDLTQEELARRVGCAAITLRKIEADDLRPSVQIAERLAMALAIPLDDRAEFVRRARAVHPEASDFPAITPAPSLDEIGREDLTGRAIRGYALAERIGMGGMGSVYRAIQPNVEREVAVKIILPAFANHPDFIRRFEAEAQLVARLEHPHIVPLYDYWREPGVAYLVMRLLRGGNVQNLLGQGPLSLDVTTHLLEQICSALNVAHRIGVIHRDLKPANVLLDEDNNAYLADFGIAKNISNPDLEHQTQIDEMVGSPRYISPEQIRSLSIKPQTDIYCLGIMLYEMLTGALPFAGPTPIDYIQQHINAPMPPLSAHHPGLPAALDAVIGQATAKNPEDRYVDTMTLFKDFCQATSSLLNDRPPMIHVEEEIDLEIANPFKGLRAFSEIDAENFFGREILVQQLLARLGEGGDLRRFLAVIGPSGSGKSSVVRAGLIPALRRGGLPGSENWFIVDMLPGKHPFEELEASLLRVAVNPPEHLLSQMKDGKRGLLRAVHRILPADATVELVLVIDQFEEIFTLIEDEAERALLLENLASAVLDERSRLRVVITLRADFTDKPLRYVDFGELMNRRFEFILPLTPDELERAILNPTQRVGLKLEKGLVSTIIREVGNQPVALPLLQYALSELFDKRDGRMLIKKAYREIGGVLGALGRSAETIYSNLDEAARSAARQLFLRLVTLGEGTEDTRRRILRDELESLAVGNSHLSAVMDVFGKARLLTFDHDPITRSATVEVAHEALLREWPRLREWLNESRADVRTQRQLNTAVQEWNAAQHDPSFLMTGSRLEQFEGWSSNTTIALTHDERAFLSASIAERDRRIADEITRQQRELENAQKFAETERQRAEEQTRSATQLRKRAYYLAGAFVIALIMAAAATFFGGQAQISSRLATSRELASASISNLEIDPERSILLALQAVDKTYAIDKTVLPEAEDALHRAVQASRVELTLRGHTDIVTGAVYSQDGTRIATSSADGTARIWDASTGIELLTIQATTEGWVNSVAFDPNGKLLATGSDDKMARIWDITTGNELLTLKGHTDYVSHVAFSPDGNHLVTASGDGTAKVWDVRTGRELATLIEGDGAFITWAVFSPDGSRIATANGAGNNIGWPSIWNAETGEKLITSPHELGYSRSVSFSRDGTRIVTCGDDRRAKIWDANNGNKLLTLYGHTDNVSNAEFSPDGTRLITVSWDRQIKVWDAATGQELFTLVGHNGVIGSVSFSPDGQQIVTASDDKTAKVWNISPSRELLTLVNGPIILSPSGAKLAYSPDGKLLASANADPKPNVWDVTTGKLLFSLIGHTGNVKRITFNSDGTRLATVSEDGTAMIWDAKSGKKLMTLSGHTDFVYGVAFSPDGSRLATGSFDSTGKIWDLTTGKVLFTLLGHQNWLSSIVFSPDGTRLATSSFDGTAKVWDAITGEELFTFNTHKDTVTYVAFNPDGTRIATSSFDGTAKVWDANLGKELFTLSGHSGVVNTVAFSPDGKYIATASSDKMAKVWDAHTGADLLTLQAPDGLTDVAFNPDGTKLAVASRDGTDRIYLLHIEDLIAFAKSRVTRQLTLEECRQYLHVDVCPAAP